MKRHFVTSRLGRGVVHATEKDDGSVEIKVRLLDHPETDNFVLQVDRSGVESFGLPHMEMLFRLSRISISHLLSQLTRGAQLDSSKLDLTVKPWNGDLAERAFGGATVGCVHLYT